MPRSALRRKGALYGDSQHLVGLQHCSGERSDWAACPSGNVLFKRSRRVSCTYAYIRVTHLTRSTDTHYPSVVRSSQDLRKLLQSWKISRSVAKVKAHDESVFLCSSSELSFYPLVYIAEMSVLLEYPCTASLVHKFEPLYSIP